VYFKNQFSNNITFGHLYFHGGFKPNPDPTDGTVLVVIDPPHAPQQNNHKPNIIIKNNHNKGLVTNFNKGLSIVYKHPFFFNSFTI